MQRYYTYKFSWTRHKLQVTEHWNPIRWKIIAASINSTSNITKLPCYLNITQLPCGNFMPRWHHLQHRPHTCKMPNLNLITPMSLSPSANKVKISNIYRRIWKQKWNNGKKWFSLLCVQNITIKMTIQMITIFISIVINNLLWLLLLLLLLLLTTDWHSSLAAQKLHKHTFSADNGITTAVNTATMNCSSTTHHYST